MISFFKNKEKEERHEQNGTQAHRRTEGRGFCEICWDPAKEINTAKSTIVVLKCLMKKSRFVLGVCFWFERTFIILTQTHSWGIHLGCVALKLGS